MEIKKLNEERKRKKITYKELSRRSNIPERTLYSIFLGDTANPRIDTMQAIERALGIADGSPLDNAEQLTDKERRLLTAFNALVEPMQDIMLEQMEKLAKVRETV